LGASVYYQYWGITLLVSLLLNRAGDLPGAIGSRWDGAGCLGVEFIGRLQPSIGALKAKFEKQVMDLIGKLWE